MGAENTPGARAPEEPTLARIGWAKQFGSNLNEKLLHVTVCNDSGIIVSGVVEYRDPIESDGYISKLDKNGGILWTYSPKVDGFETFTSVIEVADGYVYTGTVGVNWPVKNDAQNKMIIGKLDLEGKKLWENTPSYGYYSTRAESLITSRDGCFLVCGSVCLYSGDDQVFLMKLNEFGDQVWNATFGGYYDDNGIQVIQTVDGGFVVVGRTISGNSWDVLLVRFNSVGELVWSQSYGGEHLDVGYSVVEVEDGFVVAGRAKRDVKYDALVFKVDFDGDLVWERLIGYDHSERFDCIITWSDGFVAVGESRGHGSGTGDVWIVGLNSSGYVLWERFSGSTRTERAYYVDETSDGGLIVAGQSFSYTVGDQGDYYLLMLYP